MLGECRQGAVQESHWTGRLRTVCKRHGKWIGLCRGAQREPLKVPGDGIDTFRDVLSEESSGQLSQNGLKSRQSEHGNAGKQGLSWQGLDWMGYKTHTS